MGRLYKLHLCVCVSGFAGTPGYLSPEVLRKDPYGKPVDMWACGKRRGVVFAAWQRVILACVLLFGSLLD